MLRTSLLRSAAAAAVLGMGLVAQAQTETIRLTLQDALTRAEQSSLGVLIRRETVSQVLEAEARARGDLYPRVDLNARQSRNMSESDAAGVPDSYNNSFSTSLSASVSLLDTTRIANFAASRVGSEAARIGFESDLQTILEGVTSAYVTHLRNLARLDLNRANIERARVLLDLARTQLRAGVATQIDVTRAEASLAVQEQALLQQQTATFISEQNIKRLLDLPDSAVLELTSFRATRTLPDELRLLSPEAVLGARPDYRVAELTLDQNRLERRASDLQRVPTLNLSGSYGFGSDVIFDGNERQNWSIGLALSVPIFDGFQIESNQRLANSRVRAQELRVYDLQRQISTEVRVAARDAESRNAQIDVARKQAALAEEELRLARIRFEQGVADNRDLVDAQNNLAQANDNLVEALFQYDLSRLELARVRGDVRILLNEGETVAAPATP